jgi:hypothetical protein
MSKLSPAAQAVLLATQEELFGSIPLSCERFAIRERRMARCSACGCGTVRRIATFAHRGQSRCGSLHLKHR